MARSGKTYGKALVNLGITVGWIGLLVFLLPKLLVFFMPFVIGWIIAWIAGPLVLFFEEKIKIKRKAGTAFVIISAITFVSLAGYLAGAKLLQEGIGLIEDLPEIWKEWEVDLGIIKQKMGKIYEGMPESIRQILEAAGEGMVQLPGMLMDEVGTPTIEAVGNLAKYLPSFLIGLVMCLLSAYFFVAERDYVGNLCRCYLPDTVLRRWNMVMGSLKRAVGGYVKAQLKIELWMYLLLTIGFMVLKVEHALLIAFGIALLDFLPVFGTGAVLFPWTLFKLLSGDYSMALGLMILWCGGQLVRQLIQPKIVGDSIGLDPIPTLVLLFAGYKLKGVVGMILAVPAGIILINLCKEGIFDTALDSLKILISGVNHFRQLGEEDRKLLASHVDMQNHTEKGDTEPVASQKSACRRDS